MTGDLQLIPGLDYKRTRFVTLLLGGSIPSQAAKRAGYSNPSTTSVRLMADPAIQTALMEGTRERLVTDATSIAIRTIIAALRNRKHDVKLRVDTAFKVLNMVGFVPPKASDPAGDGAKPLSQQSREDLLDLVESAQKALADKATKVVNAHKPVRQPKPKPAAMLD